LLAGAGRFPIVFAKKAKSLGIPVVAVGHASLTDPDLADECQSFTLLRRASLGGAIRAFRRGRVGHWTMAGKFHKHLLFQRGRWLRLLPDWRFIRLWFFRPRRDNKDDTLLCALIAEFRAEGMECLSALDLCPELLVREGTLTRRPPTAAEFRDVQFGWNLAREMGRLDVGQSVMVRDRAVLAVEAIEGTDRAIARAGELCRNAGFVVVKLAKPEQDMRFDVPTIGPATVEAMRSAGATALAVEAGKTILLDEAETLALADRYGLTVVAFRTESVAAGR
jgi:hypothetical protein